MKFAPTLEPFALTDVELLDGPFRAAMERNATYLLSLDADRLLHNTRKYAGLKPRAPLYGGWEARGIAGHTLGHYLTAISQQGAATGDARFEERLNYIVGEMALAQKNYGDGYVGALPPLELKTLRELKLGIVEPESAFHFKGGAWVPWYTQHKILAGLKDAWVLGKNERAKEVTLRLADWTDEITRPLSHEPLQKMLRVEFGGMEATLAEIYALTGDKKYLETARRFRHDAIASPLLAGRDELAGRHANTQIPKIIGEAQLYHVVGDEDGRTIAENFWREVVHHHTYAIGGNSESEHFGAAGELAKRLGPATAETCNTYNMLKLTRQLFAWQPRAEYFDFYERALYNHILASQEPKQGMFAYFMSLKPGHFKTYSTPHDSFWCCVGSGMENHSKYGDSIYFHGADDLYINLFIPSRLTWHGKGLTVEQQTDYPCADTTELRFGARNPVELNVKIRTPQWATGGLKFELNGQTLAANSTPGSYSEIKRIWKTGDRLQITIPMSVRSEATPDDANTRAFIYGPVVLAGDFGAVPHDESVPHAIDQGDNFNKPVADVPVLVSDAPDVAAQIERMGATELVFRTDVADGNQSVTLRPFNELFTNYSTVYWNVLTPTQYAEHRAAIESEKARQQALVARTLDDYRPGEQQSEIDHNQRGENSSSGDWQSRKFRHAQNGGWFSIQQKVAPDAPVELLVTYWGGESGARTFDISVDGQTIATQNLNQNKPGEFFEMVYAIPAELTRGKSKVTLRFQARPGQVAGGVFGVRTLRQN